MRENAAAEEAGMKDIYAYTAERTKDKDIKRLLERLIKWEEEHQKLVKRLR